MRTTANFAIASFFIALAYIVKPDMVYTQSLPELLFYTIAVLFTLALANGSFDKKIFQYVVTEERKKDLVRVGVGGVLFLIGFLVILISKLLLQ